MAIPDQQRMALLNKVNDISCGLDRSGIDGDVGD